MKAGVVLVSLCGLTACAFDVSFVKTIPATFVAKPDCGEPFTLTRGESVGVGSGFPTKLQPNAKWRCSGTTEMGDVYATADQIVTVTASNMYEAMPVVSDTKLVGFYLPVDRRVAPVEPGVPLQIQR